MLWFMYQEKRPKLRGHLDLLNVVITDTDALAFQHDLSKLDWTSVLESDDVNIAANSLQQILLEQCDAHAPYRKLNLREYAPPPVVKH